jgi:hypothetical protein
MLTTDQLSSVTGVLLFTHICACVLLRITARKQREFLTQATKLPLQGFSLTPRLLLIKYYFPWVKPPMELRFVPTIGRLAFAVARGSGLLAFLWLCLVFPYTLFLVSGR